MKDGKSARKQVVQGMVQEDDCALEVYVLCVEVCLHLLFAFF